MRARRTAGAVLAAMILTVIGAAASAEMSKVRLLPGWTQADGKRIAGVEISLAPGWKTYWRASSGNGIPPQFDWTGSVNLAATSVAWPEPELFESYGMLSVGYRDKVVFPVQLTPQTPGAPIELNLSIFYGVCEDVCIPAQSDHQLTLPPAVAAEEAAIRDALSSRGRSAAEAGFTGLRCTVRPGSDGTFALTADLKHAGTPKAPRLAVFETGDEATFIMPKSVRQTDTGLEIGADLAYYGDGAFAFARDKVRLTLFSGTGESSIAFRGCPAS